MDLSAAQHQLHSNFPHQESQSPGSMITNSNSAAENQQQQPDQKKPRPPEGEPQKCPRCESTNTKFCYYNNYSLTQPRYFCKCCRRYWTKGGTLRNVPVGGGCRKSSKRASSSSSSPSPCHKRFHTRDTIITSSAASASNQVFSGLHHGYGAGMGGFGFDALMGNANFTDCDAGGNFLGHPMSFLQELHYGNGGSGLMFQGNFWDYDETAAGNSNCVSGISDDVANLAPYDDLLSSGVTAVKQEINDSINGGLWGQPWQNSINADLEPLRENWNGLVGNSAWGGLLKTPALM